MVKRDTSIFTRTSIDTSSLNSATKGEEMRKNKNFKIGDLVQVSLSGRMSLSPQIINKYKGVGIVVKKQDDRVYCVQWFGDDPHQTDFHKDFVEKVEKNT